MSHSTRASGSLPLAVLLAAWPALSCAAPAAPEADVIVTHARIWTGDPRQPEAEALAIVGERIVAVGTADEVARWGAAATRVIDAGGRRVVPGFNDAHVHFTPSGFDLANINLKGATSREEFVAMIAERVRAVPAGQWMLGGNWDHENWTPAVLPTREWIDAATGNTPVFLYRYDGHMALANTAALAMAGVSRETPDPPGGLIVRDAAGEPTGALKDAAMELVSARIPAPTHEARVAAARHALAHAASLGVTSVQDMNPSYADMAIYAELDERGELTTRIYAAPMETDWNDQARIGVRRAFGSTHYRIGAVKGYADGSLGSTTAYFFEPYVDSPRTRGLLSSEMQPPAAFLRRLTDADRAGLQLCIHAIGDQAISMVLDDFASIIRTNGERDRRFRIEHSQHVAPKDFARYASMHVIASMQPYHAIDDGRWAVKRLGPERIRTTYAFRTFLDHGVRLAFGTDWNVAPLNPMLGLYAAVTRRTLDGRNPGGWVPEQKITLAEALEAYTMGSAYAEFQESEKGSLSRGKLADLVVLSEDIFRIDPVTLPDVHVVMTMTGGRVVYEQR
jgi:predicted amidohydrolase YtcJ